MVTFTRNIPKVTVLPPARARGSGPMAQSRTYTSTPQCTRKPSIFEVQAHEREYAALRAKSDAVLAPKTHIVTVSHLAKDHKQTRINYEDW